MSTQYIEPILWGKTEFEDLAQKTFNKYVSQYGDHEIIMPPTVVIDFYDNTDENDNLVATWGYCDNFGRWTALNQSRVGLYLAKWGVKLSPNTGRVCLVRVPVKSYIDDTYIYQYIMLGNSESSILCDYHGLANITFNSQSANYVIASGTMGTLERATTTQRPINNDTLTPVNSANINTFLSFMELEDDNAIILRSILTDGLTKGNYKTVSPLTNGRNAYGLHVGYPVNNTQICVSFEKVPDWLPIFYIEDGAEAIEKYLDTGDDSDKKDPFDPNNPSITKVNNFDTSYKVSITKADNYSKIKVSIVAYNEQYIAGGDKVAGTCKMTCYEQYYNPDGSPKALQFIDSKSQPKYPTINFTHTFPLDSGDYWKLLFYFTSTVDSDASDKALGGYGYEVVLQHDTSKESFVKINRVNIVPDAIRHIDTTATTNRTNIVDGYRYINSNHSNTKCDIIFRALTLDDLDDGFPDDTDNEDDSTGESTDSGVANGMATYNINSSQFNTINQKLWSTDWTQVFKSTTIDPIQCVITCKSMPFTANTLASGEVVIANLNTGVTANKVKQVKSFNLSSILMPTYNKDFTDLRCRVHLWLPYIGWQDLPAVEVMSRASTNGLEAHPKRLGFKYIVDFVDGNCRCIVSVNGTERWVFDGNCAIDIPLTSDNHTNAINNAIRAGVGAVMSIGGAVASGYAGNPVGVVGGVVSAVQNGANAFPTYSYSTSCSPSGYIEASMNQSIMVIIERPSEMLPEDFAHVHGRPCRRVATLGAMNGFTQCSNVNVSGIDATPSERIAIKSLLESGVYL